LENTATPADTEEFVAAWIAATNSFDTGNYLGFYTDDAVLDDPGVGHFDSKAGIAEYYTTRNVRHHTARRPDRRGTADLI
jgi:ketosteroid isomerase-like protein